MGPGAAMSSHSGTDSLGHSNVSYKPKPAVHSRTTNTREWALAGGRRFVDVRQSHSASPTFAKVCRRKSAPGRYRDPKGTEAKVCNVRVLCESGRAGGDSVANVTLHVIAKAVRSLGEALELAHAPMARKICRVFFHHIH